MIHEVYELKKPKTLLPIKALIESTHIPLDKIAIFFDFDQTLTQKDGFKASLRGGEESLAFLNYLNDSNIKWYVNTAAGIGPSSTGTIATSMAQLKIPFSKSPIKEHVCMSQKVGVGYRGVAEKYGDIDIGYCNNIVSAGYNKAEAIDFVLGTIGPIELIIFVDDNAQNVKNVYDHFKGKIPIIGIVYEPYLKAEHDHQAGMELLRNEIKQLGGKRHHRRRTKHMRSKRSKRSRRK